MKIFALFTATLICGWIIFFTELARKEVVYDCRMLMGNWHPDIPQKVIEQCRERIWVPK